MVSQLKSSVYSFRVDHSYVMPEDHLMNSLGTLVLRIFTSKGIPAHALAWPKMIKKSLETINK